MKPTQKEFEALQRLVKQYDDTTEYIDSNFQRNDAISHNEYILKILAYFGLDLNFNPIPEKRTIKFKGNGFISENEDEIRNRMSAIYEKAYLDKEMLEKEPARRQLILDSNKEYEKIETIPVLVDFEYCSAFQLRNITETKII